MSPRAKILKWAIDTLDGESDTAPRCSKYPRCGGELGITQAVHDAVRERPFGPKADFDARVAANKTKPCRECQRFVAAFDRLSKALASMLRREQASP